MLCEGTPSSQTQGNSHILNPAKTYLSLQTVPPSLGSVGGRHPHLSLSFITALTTTQETTNLVFLSSPGPRGFSLWAPDPTLCLSPENIFILIINYLETMDSTVSPRKASLLFYVGEFLEAKFLLHELLRK